MTAYGTAARKLVVGLTGGIGSGKSAAADELSRLGASVIDTDAIAHELTGPGGSAVAAIAAEFGPEYVDARGAMDRARMRARAFSDPAAKKRLEALLHPLIRDEVRRRTHAASGPYVVHVVPLLVESPDYRSRVDRVLVIDAPEALQLERVLKRGLPESQVRAIMASQASRDARLAAADDVVDNSGTLDALRQRIAEHHAGYLQMARALKG